MRTLVSLATLANDLAIRIANAVSWVSPTIARLTVGLVFFQSGWGKLNDLGQVTDYFTELGLPAPAFQAGLASTAEFVCGGLLLLGCATRFAVVPLIITMIVAIRTALWDQVTGIGSLVGLLELAYIALLLWLGTHGAGPLSVDALIGTLVTRRTEHRIPAFLSFPRRRESSRSNEADLQPRYGSMGCESKEAVPGSPPARG